MIDPLSEVINLLRPRATPSSVSRLEAGDFVLLPVTPAFTLSGFEPVTPKRMDPKVAATLTGDVRHGTRGGPPDVRILGGYFVFDSPDAVLLVSLLPALIHVRGAPRSPAPRSTSASLEPWACRRWNISSPGAWPSRRICSDATTSLSPRSPSGSATVRRAHSARRSVGTSGRRRGGLREALG